MNAIFTTGLAALAAVSAIPWGTALAARCDMRVIQGETDFPMGSQLRGQHGTVLINVTLDGSGHPTAAAVERSSGHLLLDLAAQRSVLKKWQFDVSHCDHQWPAIHQVAVEYRNEEYR